MLESNKSDRLLGNRLDTNGIPKGSRLAVNKEIGINESLSNRFARITSVEK